MLQLLILLQGLLYEVDPTYVNHDFPVGGVMLLCAFLFIILVFGVAAIADFITALRKKSKQNTPTV
ncbi:MAG: hypothetical protein LBG17_02795 [Bacteroidales bacterium]|jgi:hypothetical protein|nr:hypothetical protein [Bacteroidales bacterium]